MSSKKKIPTSVKLGSRRFRVKEVKDLKDGNNTLYGWYQHTKGTICIDSELDNSLKAETLVHEILHGIFYLYMHEEKITKHEEEIVSQISKGLTAFIVDNPKFISKIQEMLNDQSD